MSSSRLTGSGAPTRRTVGVVGQHYEDTATGNIYECLVASEQSKLNGSIGGGYVWKLKYSGEDRKDHDNIFGAGGDPAGRDESYVCAMCESWGEDNNGRESLHGQAAIVNNSFELVELATYEYFKKLASAQNNRIPHIEVYSYYGMEYGDNNAKPFRAKVISIGVGGGYNLNDNESVDLCCMAPDGKLKVFHVESDIINSDQSYIHYTVDYVID